MPAGYTPPATSAEFERIKSLAGRWEGTSAESNHEGNNAAVVEYRVTSGGSAVEEKLAPGTSHEMVSMYHDVKGKLEMTHYCMLGNQPQVALKNSGANTVSLGETPSSSATLAGQMRMNSLSIEWKDENTIVQTWQGVDAEGQPMTPTVLTLKRAV